MHVEARAVAADADGVIGGRRAQAGQAPAPAFEDLVAHLGGEALDDRLALQRLRRGVAEQRRGRGIGIEAEAPARDVDRDGRLLEQLAEALLARLAVELGGPALGDVEQADPDQPPAALGEQPHAQLAQPFAHAIDAPHAPFALHRLARGEPRDIGAERLERRVGAGLGGADQVQVQVQRLRPLAVHQAAGLVVGVDDAQVGVDIGDQDGVGGMGHDQAEALLAVAVDGLDRGAFALQAQLRGGTARDLAIGDGHRGAQHGGRPLQHQRGEDGEHQVEDGAHQRGRLGGRPAHVLKDDEDGEQRRARDAHAQAFAVAVHHGREDRQHDDAGRGRCRHAARIQSGAGDDHPQRPQHDAGREAVAAPLQEPKPDHADQAGGQREQGAALLGRDQEQRDRDAEDGDDDGHPGQDAGEAPGDEILELGERLAEARRRWRGCLRRGGGGGRGRGFGRGQRHAHPRAWCAWRSGPGRRDARTCRPGSGRAAPRPHRQ